MERGGAVTGLCSVLTLCLSYACSRVGKLCTCVDACWMIITTVIKFRSVLALCLSHPVVWIPAEVQSLLSLENKGS